MYSGSTRAEGGGSGSGVCDGDLFDRIRAQSREVTRRACFVAIDSSGLQAFAELLASEPWPEEDFDPAHGFDGDAEVTLAFTLLLDAINFGSGWFPVLKKSPGLSGYRTVATACRSYFEQKGAPTGSDLRASTPVGMAKMLGQDPECTETMELMALFAQAWRDFGTWLGDGFDDTYAAVLKDAAQSAVRLVESLAEMPLYRDELPYDELIIPFYKRAQITVSDLALAFGSKGYGRFEDLDRLTLFADNLVPHVLRCRGVLHFAPELCARIDREEQLEVGSPEEVEIRAVAVEAVEQLVSALSGLGRPTTAHALDGLLWNAGQSPEIKARPRHRARCSFY